MSERTGGARLRSLLAEPGCTIVAPIFDPISARFAEAAGWAAGKLSGSVAKAVNLGVPDGISLANSSDLVDLCRRIERMSELPFLVDADSAGGNALEIRRMVRELESAGVAGVEIEDNDVPRTLLPDADRHSLMIPIDRQLTNLAAALAARRDDSLLVVARTAAFDEMDLDEALRRVAAYAETGVDAIMLPRFPRLGRRAIEEIHAVAGVPIFALRLPIDVVRDRAFMTANAIKLAYLPQVVFRKVLLTISQAYSHLAYDEASLDEVAEVFSASDDAMELLTETAALSEWDRRFPSAD